MSSLFALQFTDTHLQVNPAAMHDSRVLDDCLIGLIEKSKAASERIDLILMTGDLADDPESANYQLIYKRLQTILASYFTAAVPVLVVPGNHDLQAPLSSVFYAHAHYHDLGLTLEDWHFILVNSSLEERAGGWLREEELLKIRAQLELYGKTKNMALIMHHPPVPIGSQWLDTMMISNASALDSLFRQHPKVRVCLWGHVHQVFDETIDGIRQLGSPAVYPRQFLPKSPEFAVDSSHSSGCRLLEFQANGDINTQIIRL